MRRLLPLLLLGPVLPVALGAGAPAQALSCIGVGPVVSQAEHVFTARVAGHHEKAVDGTVDGAVDVVVDEVWAGGPVPERLRVEVDQGLAMWMPWGTGGTDRAGTTWVLATDGSFTVNACSIWDVEDRGVRQHRPAHPEEPVPAAAAATEAGGAGLQSAGEPAPGVPASALAVGLAGLLVAGSGLLVAWRRGRSRP